MSVSLDQAVLFGALVFLFLLWSFLHAPVVKGGAAAPTA